MPELQALHAASVDVAATYTLLTAFTLYVGRFFDPIRDLRGTADVSGRELHSTLIAVADEIAAAAELVIGKARSIPAAIVRGADA